MLGEGGVFSESLLEGRGHGVALEERDALDKIIFLLLGGREFLEVHEDAEVVALFGSGDVGTVFAFEDFLGAVLDELVEAFQVDANEDLGFGGRRGDVEGDVVEVGDDLVNRRGCGTVVRLVCGEVVVRQCGITYSGANRSLNRLSISTFW